MATLPLRRPALRVEILVALVTIYLVATVNAGWWAAVWKGRGWNDPESWLFGACCFMVLTALHFILLAPLAWRWTAKPLLTLVVLASAAAAYFVRAYHVLLDPTMIQNVLATDAKETRDLMSAALIGSVLLWSAPAIFVIWFFHLEQRPWLRLIGFRVVSLVAAFVVAVIAMLPISRDLTSFMRNERTARYLITPGNLIVGLAQNLFGAAKKPAGPRAPIGRDARVVRPAGVSQAPRLLVLVIGETARAANFSLFGYGRDTNPELSRRDVLAFTNVTSCGTTTEISVPCMFSPFGREDYDAKRIRGSEGLLDVLKHAGFRVVWIDNQSGCKRVCPGEGIEYRKLDAKVAPDFCKDADHECHDEILIGSVAAELAALEQDTVLVLHMMGNHGPAYYRRYPPSFRRFVPECTTGELRQCTREEVVNSYDNAILYTDFVLAKIVDVLAAPPPAVPSGMIYVSDHGESLGENDLYLHGLPYSIAPKVQTHVPMVAWFSGAFMEANKIDTGCARGLVNNRYSHDNLFHSTLGLMDVQTSSYRRERDLFSPCREVGR